MAYQFGSIAIDGPIITITLDRPEHRNALSVDASYELGDIFDDFEANPALRLAILTGAGDKAFCAGADLRTPDSHPVRRWPAPESGFAGLVARFNRRKPVIAAVNGFAMGGGFEAALACDIIVAADHASFGLTEPRVGLAALGGGIQRLVEELGPKRAHVLLLTARKISVQEAAALGLVAEVVPAADLMATARRWAEDILECSPTSIAATKAVLRKFVNEGLEASITGMFALPEVSACVGGPDAREGVKAFAEKRKPIWADLA